MTVWQAVILGILQGFTEFLPVSSSGHLVLAQHLLNVLSESDLMFDVYVHVGTLISVFVVLWNDIIAIVRAVGSSLLHMKIREDYKSDEYVRMGVAIVVGSIPAGVIGVMYHERIKDAFTDPKLVAMNLVITGLILFLTRLARPNQNKRVGVVSSFIIGLAQAFAILPGISRSGSTISAAMYLKLTPVRAARFSFLLSIPVIAGAALFETKSMIKQGVDIGALPLIAGTIAAAITGYFSIKVLLKFLEKGRISWFAIYCLVVGILGIIFV